MTVSALSGGSRRGEGAGSEADLWKTDDHVIHSGEHQTALKQELCPALFLIKQWLYMKSEH